jgi:hypothetical protein
MSIARVAGRWVPVRFRVVDGGFRFLVPVADGRPAGPGEALVDVAAGSALAGVTRRDGVTMVQTLRGDGRMDARRHAFCQLFDFTLA